MTDRRTLKQYSALLIIITLSVLIALFLYLQQKLAAYIVSLSPADMLPKMQLGFLLQFLLSTLLILVTAWFLYRSQVQRQKLLTEKNQLEAITQSMGEGLYVLDKEGNVILVNTVACNMLGYSEQDMLGKKAHYLFHSHALNQHLTLEQCPVFSSVLNGNNFVGEEIFCKSNGEHFPVRIHSRPLKEGSRILGSVAVFSDISLYKAEEAHQHLLTSALEHVANGVVITDPDAKIEWVNNAFEKMTGYMLAEVTGHKPSEFVKSGRQNRAFYQQMWDCINSGQVWHGELINKRKNGSFYHEELTIAPVKDKQGKILHFVGVKQDITERKVAEQRIRRLAHYDLLTGLPNRALFTNTLQKAIKIAKSQQKLAVLFIDLDKFKPVNDQFGHDTGDQLLQEVALRIKACIRDNDTAARTGGDEFVVLLAPLDSTEQARLIGEKILHTVKYAFLLADTEIFISASIGIALYPQHATDVTMLLKHADEAMYQAKQSGRDQVMLYNAESDKIS